MYRKVIALSLCTVVLAAGCGSSVSDNKTDTASAPASSSAVTAGDSESEEELSIPINLSSTDEVRDSGLTESEVQEMAYYLTDSWDDYPDGDYIADDAMMEFRADSAPTTPESPESGKYGDFIELADYKGMEIAMPEGTEIENGMNVNIDYSGTLGDEALDSGSDTDFDLVVGEGALMDGLGFEEQLIGHKKGDSFQISVDFPKDYYDESLAGQTAVFDVTVNELYRMTPDLALSQVQENSKVIRYPEEMLSQWREDYLNEMKNWSYGTVSDAEALIEENYSNEDSFENMLRINVKEDLVYRAIMDAEGISPDSDEYKEAMEKTLALYGLNTAEEAEDIGLSASSLNLAVENRVCEGILSSYQNS